MEGSDNVRWLGFISFVVLMSLGFCYNSSLNDGDTVNGVIPNGIYDGWTPWVWPGNVTIYDASWFNTTVPTPDTLCAHHGLPGYDGYDDAYCLAYVFYNHTYWYDSYVNVNTLCLATEIGVSYEGRDYWNAWKTYVSWSEVNALKNDHPDYPIPAWIYGDRYWQPNAIIWNENGSYNSTMYYVLNFDVNHNMGWGNQKFTELPQEFPWNRDEYGFFIYTAVIDNSPDPYGATIPINITVWYVDDFDILRPGWNLVGIQLYNGSVDYNTSMYVNGAKQYFASQGKDWEVTKILEWNPMNQNWVVRYDKINGIADNLILSAFHPYWVYVYSPSDPVTAPLGPSPGVESLPKFPPDGPDVGCQPIQPIEIE